MEKLNIGKVVETSSCQVDWWLFCMLKRVS